MSTDEQPHPPISQSLSTMVSQQRSRSRSKSPVPRTSVATASRPEDVRSRSRSRSRSPRRKSKSNSGGGFRWKEKPRRDERDGERDRGLERGYRHNRDDRYAPRHRSPRASQSRRDDIAAAASGNKAEPMKPTAKDASQTDRPKKEKKEKKEKEKAAVPQRSNEPMIIVNVNDRLGTKAAIPCLASDPIRLFKAQVAARIGRQPHEIMLKRQGERPMKDMLTLEDYGVSNGVQLDLELDTGD